MKSERRAMMVAGWSMTIIGSGTVLFWVLYEAIMDFTNAPIPTIIGVAVVLALMALLVPLPLILATRRAKARRKGLLPGNSGIYAGEPH